MGKTTLKNNMGGIYDIGHYYLIFDMNGSLVDSMSFVDCHDRGGGGYFLGPWGHNDYGG